MVNQTLEMPFPKVELQISPEGETQLLVDGVSIPGVGAVSIESMPGEAPKVTIEIVPGELSVEAQAILTPHIMRAGREGARTHSSK